LGIEIREMTAEDFAELERAEAQPGARIDKSLIPPLLIEGLRNYAEKGVPVGSFLEHVISNNFVDAVGQADAYSRVALPSIASYIYMDMPQMCWGSKHIYKAWIAFHRAEREGVEGADLQVFADSLNAANGAAADWRSGKECSRLADAEEKMSELKERIASLEAITRQ
jgi:hypothetical protein